MTGSRTRTVRGKRGILTDFGEKGRVEAQGTREEQ